MKKLTVPDLEVVVGRPIRITPEERRQLQELAFAMEYGALCARKGWLFDYVKAMREINRIIGNAVSRAHGN